MILATWFLVVAPKEKFANLKKFQINFHNVKTRTKGFVLKEKPHNIGTFFIFSFSSLQLYIIFLVNHMAFKFGGEWDTMGANVW